MRKPQNWIWILGLIGCVVTGFFAFGSTGTVQNDWAAMLFIGFVVVFLVGICRIMVTWLNHFTSNSHQSQTDQHHD